MDNRLRKYNIDGRKTQVFFVNLLEMTEFDKIID